MNYKEKEIELIYTHRNKFWMNNLIINVYSFFLFDFVHIISHSDTLFAI